MFNALQTDRLFGEGERGREGKREGRGDREHVKNRANIGINLGTVEVAASTKFIRRDIPIRYHVAN